MGRKRARATKELSGTLRPDREKPIGGEELLTRRPGPPRDLAPAARQPWRELAEAAIGAGVLKASALPMLRVAAEALALYRHALNSSLEGPLMTPGSRGQLRASPASAAAATWWTRVLAALAQLGLTPRSIGLTNAQPPATHQEDSLEEIIRRGQGSLNFGKETKQ